MYCCLYTARSGLGIQEQQQHHPINFECALTKGCAHVPIVSDHKKEKRKKSCRIMEEAITLMPLSYIYIVKWVSVFLAFQLKSTYTFFPDIPIATCNGISNGLLFHRGMMKINVMCHILLLSRLIFFFSCQALLCFRMSVS